MKEHAPPPWLKQLNSQTQTAPNAAGAPLQENVPAVPFAAAGNAPEPAPGIPVPKSTGYRDADGSYIIDTKLPFTFDAAAFSSVVKDEEVFDPVPGIVSSGAAIPKFTQTIRAADTELKVTLQMTDQKGQDAIKNGELPPGTYTVQTVDVEDVSEPVHHATGPNGQVWGCDIPFDPNKPLGFAQPDVTTPETPDVSRALPSAAWEKVPPFAKPVEPFAQAPAAPKLVEAQVPELLPQPPVQKPWLEALTDAEERLYNDHILAVMQANPMEAAMLLKLKAFVSPHVGLIRSPALAAEHIRQAQATGDEIGGNVDYGNNRLKSATARLEKEVARIRDNDIRVSHARFVEKARQAWKDAVEEKRNETARLEENVKLKHLQFTHARNMSFDEYKKFYEGEM